jgi:hypothetical protein
MGLGWYDLDFSLRRFLVVIKGFFSKKLVFLIIHVVPLNVVLTASMV